MRRGRKGCAEVAENDRFSRRRVVLSWAKAFQVGVGSPLSHPSLGETPRQGARQMQKITPFLWFDGKAEEAMEFYTSTFKNSRVISVTRYGDAGPGPKGSVMSATFELLGREFIALNGGPHFSFTPAISFFVTCKTQQEVDELWQKLVAGGQPQRCGWLTDRFGVSWQIIPSVLGEMLQDKDAEKSSRVMKAMLTMVKLDIAGLEQAYGRQ
jgi:predicted 3-demethylubiquinone-9 3-methyltransferase (glyoxalase superfamily)